MAWLRIAAVLCLAATIIYAYLQAIPLLLTDDVSPAEGVNFPPRDLDELRSLLQVMQARSRQQWSGVFALYCTAYIIKQTFAIPGSAMMNVLGGALYGHVAGTVLVAILTALGSTGCYFVSWAALSAAFLDRIGLGERVRRLRDTVKQNERSGDLFFYLLFGRLFPFTPNWFVNMASPHVGVGVVPFFASILLGLIPYNFITVGAGEMLNEISSLQDVFKPAILARLVVVALVVLSLPVLKRRMSSKPGIRKALVD